MAQAEAVGDLEEGSFVLPELLFDQGAALLEEAAQVEMADRLLSGDASRLRKRAMACRTPAVMSDGLSLSARSTPSPAYARPGPVP